MGRGHKSVDLFVSKGKVSMESSSNPGGLGLLISYVHSSNVDEDVLVRATSLQG